MRCMDKKRYLLEATFFFLLTLFFRCSLSDSVTLVKSRDRSCGKVLRIRVRYFLCSSRGFPCNVRLQSCERFLNVCRTLLSSVRRFPCRYIIFKLESSTTSAERDVSLLKDRSSHVRSSGLSTTCNTTKWKRSSCVL